MRDLLIQHTLNLISQAARTCHPESPACHPELDSGSRPIKIILGLSGGPDSVFLLYLLKKLQDKQLVTVYAAHLNHGWRESAVGDADFCRDLCEKLGIPITIEHAKNINLDFKYNGSKEELGRKIRRHFFEQVRIQEKADFIMLAHHLQDQQETFFMRMLRGVTLSGLCGMQAISGVYLRPLLQTNKQEMLDYLHAQGISYRHDETNDSDDFLRNRIRKQVLPAMQACDTRFDGNFMRLMEHLRADDELLERLTKETFDRVFQDKRVAHTAEFLVLESQLQKRVLLYWLIQENASFTPSDSFLCEIIRFLMVPGGGTHRLNVRWMVVKRKGLFWLENMESMDNSTEFK